METVSETIKITPPYEEVFGSISTEEESNSTFSFWDRYMPRDVPFFKIALLDQLIRRPYHKVTLEGPFNLKQLVEDNRNHTFRSEANIDRSGKSKIQRLLLRLDGGVYGYFEHDTFQIYAPTSDAAQAVARQFRRYVKPLAVGKAYFNVISVDQNGANTEPVVIERLSPITTEDLALNYGEDFPSWEKQWTERMRQTPSGLTIFHGPPGCGKTSYLRALMARLIDQAVFYFIPVSEADLLSNPRFVTFWLKETNRHEKKRKIAILEDAEELLLPRDAGSRDKVSNLLNLADGFLGDHLKLHVIATTNSPVRQLDPALLRPGRLMGTRGFRRLTRPEAQRLAAAKGLALPAHDDFSLAELYCGAVACPVSTIDRHIGFAQ